jgi:hypothetical protein
MIATRAITEATSRVLPGALLLLIGGRRAR